MQKHRVGIVLAVCGAALFVLIAIKVRSNDGRTKTLPDGTRLEFEGVAHPGKILLYGNSFQKALDRVMPNRPRRMLGFPVPKAVRLHTPSDPHGACLGAWLSIRSESHLERSPMNDYRFIAVGSSGQEFENSPEQFLISSREKVVREVKLNRFPRNEKEFALKVLRRQGADWEHAATFTIPNPLPSRTEEWTPVSLPHTNAFQQVAVTVEKCTVVERDTPAGERLETELSLRFFTNGIPTADFGISDCVLHDEEGNYGVGVDPVWDGNLLTVRAPFTLATNRVWRLRLTIDRRRNFSQDQQVHLRNLPTAGNTEVLATNRLGDSVLVSVTGDSFRCTPKNPPTATKVAIMDVRDESGAKLKLLQQFWTSESTEGVFTTPPSSFDLTLAIYRTMTVELFVRPDLPSQ